MSKFSQEKQIRELECKLQLQMSSMGSNLQQMSELDATYKAFCKDLSRLNVEYERLDASGLYAVSFDIVATHYCKKLRSSHLSLLSGTKIENYCRKN